MILDTRMLSMWEQNFHGFKSISSCDQYANPAQIFFMSSKFSCLLFLQPHHPIKLKVGQQICEGLLIANHLDQSLWSKTLSSSHIMFITLFSAGVQCYCTFYQPLQVVKLYWAKTIFLSQTGKYVWNFFMQF
jgi:hypothetical protein